MTNQKTLCISSSLLLHNKTTHILASYSPQKTARNLVHCWGASLVMSLVSRTDYSKAHCSGQSWAKETGRCSDSKKVTYWAVKKAMLMDCLKDPSLAERVLKRNMTREPHCCSDYFNNKTNSNSKNIDNDESKNIMYFILPPTTQQNNTHPS